MDPCISATYKKASKYSFFINDRCQSHWREMLTKWMTYSSAWFAFRADSQRCSRLRLFRTNSNAWLIICVNTNRHFIAALVAVMHLLVCVLPNCCAIQTSSLLASSAMSERHWAHHWGVCAQSINQSVRRWYMTTSITKAKIISAIRRIANININNVNVVIWEFGLITRPMWDQQTAF